METGSGGSRVNRDNCPDLFHGELPKFDIKEAESICAGMFLNTLMVGGYMVVTNSEFDVVVSDEPYVALMLLVSLKSGRFFARVWNQTITTGKVLSIEEVAATCRNLFGNGRLCLGKPQSELQREEGEFLFLNAPFQRIVSRNCQKFLGRHETDGSNTCRECMRLNDIVVNAEIKGETMDTDEEEAPVVMAMDLMKEEINNEDEVAPISENIIDKYKCNQCSDFPSYFTTFKDLCNHLREAHKNYEYANDRRAEQMSTKIESCPLPQINVNKSITELPPITDPMSHRDEKSRRRARNMKQYKKVNRTYKCEHSSFARSHASIWK